MFFRGVFFALPHLVQEDRELTVGALRRAGGPRTQGRVYTLSCWGWVGIVVYVFECSRVRVRRAAVQLLQRWIYRVVTVGLLSGLFRSRTHAQGEQGHVDHGFEDRWRRPAFASHGLGIHDIIDAFEETGYEGFQG